jgi:hypothetical protein
MSPDRAWKRSERRVAAIIGGERVPVSGRQRGDVPDIAHPTLSVEVKHRRAIPAWLLTAMAQASAAARPDQTPVAILHRHGARHRDDLAVMRLADLAVLLDDPARGRVPP